MGWLFPIKSKHWQAGLLWLEKAILFMTFLSLGLLLIQFWALNDKSSSSPLIVRALPPLKELEKNLPPSEAYRQRWASQATKASLSEKNSPRRSVRKKHQARSSKPAPKKIHFPKVDLLALEALPGIGPKLAQRILLAHQGLPQGMQCFADLDAVSGIGPKLLAKLKPWLDLPGEKSGQCHAALSNNEVSESPLSSSLPQLQTAATSQQPRSLRLQ